MDYNSNIDSGSYKDYEYRTYDTSDDFVERIRCRECGKSILGVGDFRTGRVITYERDNFPNQRIEHEHTADVVTKTDLMHRTAVEIRYIKAPNKDDRRYLMDDKRRVMAVD